MYYFMRIIITNYSIQLIVKMPALFRQYVIFRKDYVLIQISILSNNSRLICWWPINSIANRF